MSIVINRKPTSPTQRATEAAHLAGAVLGLDDVKRLTAALAQASAEVVQKNRTFADRVRYFYEDMSPKPNTPLKNATGSAKKVPEVALIPIRQIEGDHNPAASPDPYFLLDLYGPHQLRQALNRYTALRLKESVKIVQQRSSHGKPSGAAKPALITYIVETVAGPGY